ncbi:expressed unknown protein [Seminavis robusta]|uniref:Uncharacterized protein n=1 Tax=Seminavis robusta TaxID=568900 RepID=A0A9N8ECC0_9STRA|nr:expressed unknown protein [Seminavis robusta]|eukprot:Sro739_g195370.1 n/a (532) ;mRNA; f:7821-9416
MKQDEQQQRTATNDSLAADYKATEEAGKEEENVPVLHGSIAPLPSVNELGRGQTSASTITSTSTPGAFAVAPTPFAINDPPPPSMEPMASTADDSRLVEAELVTPPVEAIQVLSSDDLERQEPTNNRKNDQVANTGTLPEQGDNKRWLWPIAAVIICVLAAALVVTLLVLLRESNQESSSLNDAGLTTRTNLSLPEINEIITVTPAPTFDYPCFSESLELNFALVQNPHQDLFVMCPNSHIRIGIMRIPSVNNTYINGQDPLFIVRSNVEVRCGLDGSSSNNCTLDGGTSQLVIMYYGENQYGITPQDVQNVTVRGITFTGTLDQGFQFGSTSVLVANQQAKDIQLIDCRWQHSFVPLFLVYVGINPYLWSQGTMALPSRGNQVSIVDSTFTNITYGSALFAVMDQVVSIERGRFSDLKVEENPRNCDLQGPVFCTNVMYCALSSHCSIHDTCLQDVEYLADAGLLTASLQAEWDISNIHGDLVLADRQIDANQFETCDSAVGQYKDHLFSSMECADPAPLYDASPVCPLL